MFDSERAPIALFSFETKDQWGSTEYAHARIRFGYEDEADHTPRNFSDHVLADLVITSQGNSRDAKRHLYALEARYQDVYAVDTRKAEGILKTLRKIDKALEAANFDICEAYYVWAHDWGEYAVITRLERLGFRARPMLDGYADLEDNAKDIYEALNARSEADPNWYARAH